jgi:hypothetical protein
VDLGDDGLIGGVDDFEGFAVDAFDEFVVDEAGGVGVGSGLWLSDARMLEAGVTHRPVGCSYSPV